MAQSVLELPKGLESSRDIQNHRDVQSLNSRELSLQVETSQKRIEQGIASDQDYVVFVMCQLELAERGIIQS